VPVLYSPVPLEPLQPLLALALGLSLHQRGKSHPADRSLQIRCSGFENSEDGRCLNCTRFSQECIFTPVSAQTQAFVPAHTVYGRGVPPGGPPPALYGAYGQPLPPGTPTHYAPPPQGSQPQYAQPGAPHYPSTTAGYAPPPNPYGQPQPVAQAGTPTQPNPPVGSPQYDDRSRDPNSRKRPTNEPHTPTLPPPNPAAQAQQRGQPVDGDPHQYKYPDPTHAAVSPASSNASYHSGQQSAPQQPYYSTTASAAPRRSSPQSTYSSYDASRASSSPRTGGAPSTPSTSTYAYSSGDNALRPPPQTLPIRQEGRTPPPSRNQPEPRSAGMSISNLVSADHHRSAADSDMLNRLR